MEQAAVIVKEEFDGVVSKGESGVWGVLGVVPHGRTVGLVDSGRDWGWRQRGLQTTGGHVVVEFKFGSQVLGRSSLREENRMDEHLSGGHLLKILVVVS